GFSQFRTPYRFQIPAALGLAVVVGMVLTWLRERLGEKTGRRLVVAVGVLICADLLAHRLVNGFPIQTREPQGVYAEIARDQRDRLVLEVPLGVQTGTDRIGLGEPLIFYQPTHRKRLINGILTRAPLAALEDYRASPALMFLADEAPPPGDVKADLLRQIT